MRNVISVSRRTDVPAWYGRWFSDRLTEGKACYVTPFSSRVYEVSLRREDVIAFVFWTRNVRPFLPVLDLLDGDGCPYYFQYTVNGYPERFEPGVPFDAGLRGLEVLAKRLGPERVVWRYDPIVLTADLDHAFHIAKFREIASRLHGLVRSSVVSFLDRYRKTERRMKEKGIEAVDLSPEEGTSILIEMRDVAKEAGIDLATCCEEKCRPSEVPAGACIDRERLKRIIPDPDLALSLSPTREGCLCAASRDIGAYNTCPAGCVYCYAVRSHEEAMRNYKNHRLGVDRFLW